MGEAFAARLRRAGTGPEQSYVEAMVQALTKGKVKPFRYRGVVISGAPNAFALPGGVIAVTDQMLHLLTNEAQLVGVLGHEIGHVERGHTLDSVRMQIVSRHLGEALPGEIADALYAFFVRPAFSKTQESEADDYAFALLTTLHYAPEAMVQIFVRLSSAMPQQTQRGFDPLRDYLSSHPPLVQRIAAFTARAEHWRFLHPGTEVYVGERNLAEHLPRSATEYPEEVH